MNAFAFDQLLCAAKFRAALMPWLVLCWFGSDTLCRRPVSRPNWYSSRTREGCQPSWGMIATGTAHGAPEARSPQAAQRCQWHLPATWCPLLPRPLSSCPKLRAAAATLRAKVLPFLDGQSHKYSLTSPQASCQILREACRRGLSSLGACPRARRQHPPPPRVTPSQSHFPSDNTLRF